MLSEKPSPGESNENKKDCCSKRKREPSSGESNENKQYCCSRRKKEPLDPTDRECWMCVEEVNYKEPRALAKLPCCHEFHLDCIGAVINYEKGKKGIWCPLCNSKKFKILEDIPPALCISPTCSICLELVVHHKWHPISRLKCKHVFHLDCIIRAFNAKGAMQCPNCRQVEDRTWYTDGLDAVNLRIQARCGQVRLMMQRYEYKDKHGVWPPT